MAVFDSKRRLIAFARWVGAKQAIKRVCAESCLRFYSEPGRYTILSADGLSAADFDLVVREAK